MTLLEGWVSWQAVPLVDTNSWEHFVFQFRFIICLCILYCLALASWVLSRFPRWWSLNWATLRVIWQWSRCCFSKLISFIFHWRCFNENRRWRRLLDWSLSATRNRLRWHHWIIQNLIELIKTFNMLLKLTLSSHCLNILLVLCLTMLYHWLPIFISNSLPNTSPSSDQTSCSLFFCWLITKCICWRFLFCSRACGISSSTMQRCAYSWLFKCSASSTDCWKCSWRCFFLTLCFHTSYTSWIGQNISSSYKLIQQVPWNIS